jgi:RimJ/RimL family protein N-acetyltransferase
MEESDIEIVRKIHNDSGVIGFLSDPVHVTQEEQKQWFKSLSLSRSSRRYVIVLKLTQEICGVIRIEKIDQINKSAEVGIDIDPPRHRQGIAYEAYLVLMDFLFKDQGMNRLNLVTLRNNIPAISLYQKLGFQVEGILRRAIFRNGEYTDLLLMSILAEEWSEMRSN